MFCQERLQIRAADFLLPFQQENQIHRQIAVGFQSLADPAQVGHVLTFVIGRSPGVNPPVFDPWLEGIGNPLFHRINRLHIIVTIDHHRRPTGAVGIPRHHDGVAFGRVDLGAQPHPFQLGAQPFGIRQHIRRVAGISGNTPETESGEQVFKVGGLHESQWSLRRKGSSPSMPD